MTAERCGAWETLDDLRKMAPGWDGKVWCPAEHGWVSLLDHDHAKALRIWARMAELGGTEFWVSPDICHMLVAGCPHPGGAGLRLVCDPDLPLNGIMRADAKQGWKPMHAPPELNGNPILWHTVEEL